MNDIMDYYTRAQAEFDAALTRVPAEGWDRPSACEEWTVRDVTGHAIWGQQLVRSWATGQPEPDLPGAPGTPSPEAGKAAGDDPLATWRATRERSVAALTPDALQRVVPSGAFGGNPVVAFLGILVLDFLAHTWDVHQDIRLDPELVTWAFEGARHKELRRAPGFLGPALTAPSGADEQTRFLAFLGRRAW